MFKCCFLDGELASQVNFSEILEERKVVITTKQSPLTVPRNEDTPPTIKDVVKVDLIEITYSIIFQINDILFYSCQEGTAEEILSEIFSSYAQNEKERLRKGAEWREGFSVNRKSIQNIPYNA
jgi:hypothetical protein